MLNYTAPAAQPNSLAAAGTQRRALPVHPHLLLSEFCTIDARSGLGRCVNPRTGVRPDIGVVICAVEMAHAAERGLVWTRRWRGAVSGVSCQIQIVGIVHFPPGTRIKSLRTPNKCGL